MTIDITPQTKLGAGYPMMPVRVLTSTAAPFDILGVPTRTGAREVVGVRLVITNASGAEIDIPCERVRDGHWAATFAASCFAAFGEVERGFRVVLTTEAAGGGASSTAVAGLARLVIVAASADAVAGDALAAFQTKGGDVYLKSRMVGGVQHYVRQTVAFDEEMGAWGAEWSGDYILATDGEFVSADADTDADTESTETEGGAE